MKNTFIIALFGFFLIPVSMSQDQYSVSGTILDEAGQTLPGATIFLPELEMGAVSDDHGNFMISGLPDGKFIFNISYVGFETHIRTIFIGGKDHSFTIHMIPTQITGKEIVISGGRHSSQHKNAVKIEVLKVREINQAGHGTLVENLTAMPGVDMINGGGGVVTPVIRGLSTSNILMLNNGIRLENYQFSQDHPYLVDESGLDQVEIIKGPASLLYGSDAIGGVINLVQDYSIEPNTVSGEAHMKYFSNSQGYSGNIGIHGNQNRISWSLHGGARTFKDYTDGNKEKIPNTRSHGGTFKSFIGLRLNHSLHRLRYEYQKYKPGMTNEQSINLIHDDKRISPLWFQDLDNHLLASTNSWFLNPFKVQFNASYQKNLRKLYTDEIDHPAVDMDLTTLSYETRGNLVTSEVSEFTFAIQGLHQANRNRDGEIRVLPDYAFNDLAFFGLVQHDFTNNIHLQVGLRFDNRFLDVPTQEKASHSHEDPIPGEEPEILEGFYRYYGNISGSLGATCELADGVLLRGNLASAYRAPSIAELTQDGEHGIRYEQGNLDLRSQRNYEFDFSFHYHKDHIMMDLAGYYNQINDYIYLSHTTDTTNEGMIIYRYTQNNATLYGFESVLEVLPFPSLSFKMGYNYARGIHSGNENLPFIPQNKLHTELTYMFHHVFSKGQMSLKLGSDYAFRQNHPSEFETHTSSYFIMHTGVGINLPLAGHTFSFNILVRNIFNTAYQDHLSVLNELDYYNMGRNVAVSLSIPFHIYQKPFND